MSPKPSKLNFEVQQKAGTPNRVPAVTQKTFAGDYAGTIAMGEPRARPVPKLLRVAKVAFGSHVQPETQELSEEMAKAQ